MIGNRNNSATETFTLNSYDARDLYDMDEWSTGVTAAGVVLPDDAKTNLLHVENGKIAQYLEHGFGCALSVAEAFRTLNLMSTDYHPIQRQFRRSTGSEEIVVCFPDSDRNALGVYLMKNKNTLYSIKKWVREICVDESKMLPNFSVSESYEKLVRRFGADKCIAYELLSLTINSRKRRQLFLHPALGVYMA